MIKIVYDYCIMLEFKMSEFPGFCKPVARILSVSQIPVVIFCITTREGVTNLLFGKTLSQYTGHLKKQFRLFILKIPVSFWTYMQKLAFSY